MPDVAWLEANTTDVQYRKWVLFYRAEPWGSEIEWLRAAMIAAMIANVNRKRGSAVIKAEDLVPNFVPPGVKPAAAIVNTVKAEFAAVFGGRVKMKKKGNTNGNK